MKIVVIGGTGLIGRNLVSILRDQGHEPVVAARSHGIDAFTGKGLASALNNSDVVVDVSNSGYARASDMVRFFEGSGITLLAAELLANVAHHVVLSAVGTGALQHVGYFRAKHAQEELVRASGMPFTIVRSAPFFEFLYNIVDTGGSGNQIRVPPVSMEPVSAYDVAAMLAEIAVAQPENAIVEVAGPDRYLLHDLAEEILVANEDLRDLKADALAHYFGGPICGEPLVAAAAARRTHGRFEDWLRQSLVVA